MQKVLPDYRRGSAPIFALIAVLFVAGIAAAFYFGQNYSKTSTPTATDSATTNTTSDETKDWKTYKNTKVGFEFKYPPKYNNPIIPAGRFGGSPADGTETGASLIFDDGSTEQFILEFSQTSGSLEDLRKTKETPSTSQIVLIRKTKIDQTIVEWYIAEPPMIYPDNGETGRIEVYFIKNGYGFSLTSSRGHSEEEIKQILSTFKFTQ